MKLLCAALATALLLAVPTANAADRKVEMSLQALVNSQLARDAGIDGSVRFFLSGQSHPAVAQRFGDGVVNKKTNAFGKSDEEACQWVALSVLKSLQESAKARGANAVIDIVSYFRKQTFTSASNYECRAGALMAGVALKGTYAKIN